MSIPGIAYDDLPALQAQISDTFGPWGRELDVTQDMIQTFADLTGDHYWIHLDEERCRTESPYGRPIAHGLLTLSLMPSVIPEPAFEVTGYQIFVNYGSDRLRYTGVVPAGSRIHSRTRLKDVSATPSGTLMKLEVQVAVVGEDRPALVCELLALYR